MLFRSEPLYDEPLFPADATTPILPAPPKEAPAPEAAPVPAPPAPTEAPPSPGAQRAPLMDYIDAPASGEALEEAAEPAAEEAPVTHHAVRF